MPHMVTHGRAAVTAPLVVALACLGLAACGSSSGGHVANSQTGNAAAPIATGTPTTAPTPANAPSSSTATESTTPAANKLRRQDALRMVRCMLNNGIKLPPPGREGYIHVNGSAAGSAKFKAALTKCRPVLEVSGSASNPK
jgi:hypothetical protein